MVAFDASTPAPTTDPNWLGWSRSVKQPEADKSGEILGKTIGTSLQKTGEIAGDLVENQSQTGAEDILRGQISNLQNFDTLVKTQDPNAPPQDVQKAQQVAETLGSAKANGAISPTYYYGQLDKYASDLRSRYGGLFNKQIDQGIAKATGVTHTANELYQSTLKDINSFLTKKDDLKNRALTEIQSNMGAPGASDAWSKVSSGEWTPSQGMEYANKVQSRKFQLQGLHEEISTAQSLGQDQARMTERVFTGVANNYIAEQANRVAEKFGFKNQSEMEYAMQHPEQFSSVDMQQVATAHAQLELALRKGLQAEANKMVTVTNPQTGKQEQWTYAQLAPDKYQGVIENSLKTYHAQGELIKDKDVGGMAYWTKMTQAAEADATHQVLKDEHGIANPVLWVNALKKLGMPDYVLEAATSSMKDNLAPKIKAAMESTKMRSWLTPNQAAAVGGGAKPATSLQEDIDAWVQKYGVKSPTVFNQFVDDLGHIQDKTIPDEQKAAKIWYMFNPKNSDVLANWHREGLQPDGKFDDKPGRYNIFSAMTSPEVTKEVRRLDSSTQFRKYNLWDTYKSTSTALLDKLIGGSTRDLNSFELKDPGKFTYDSDKHEFTYRKDPQRQMFASTAEEATDKTIKQINMGLHRMADIAKAENSDPNAYIYNTLSALGYRFEDHPKTVTGALLNSIVATKLAERKTLEAQRKKLLEQGTRE